jgi:hypothetical protein
LQPIVTRARPILVFAALPPAGLSFAGLSFAGLAFAGLSPGDLPAANLSSTGPILAARFIVSPALARLRFVGPIFGSHVSKDYSRKSSFDKPSKHFFRETSIAPAARATRNPSQSHRHHQHRIRGQLVGRGQAARPRKPDSGDTGTISITVRMRRTSRNAMKPRIQCVPTQ